MQSVSVAFLAAAAADNRKPRLKVDVLWTDPFVNAGMTVNSLESSPARISWEDPHLVDTQKQTPYKYLILDGTCTAGEGCHPAPSTAAEAANSQFGWYSGDVCDGDGDFATPPAVEVVFAEVRPIRQLYVVGEPTIGQYPTSFDITIYDASLPGGKFGPTEYLSSEVETFIDLTSEGINSATKMELAINSWSFPNTVSKIVEFFGTVSDTFYTDDIESLNILEEREVGTATVPTGNLSCNEMDVEFQNVEITRENGEVVKDPFFPDNPDSYLKDSVTPNVRLTPYMGLVLPDTSTEWVKLGTFWTADWSCRETDTVTSVSARDRMELLRLVEFRLDQVLTDVSLYDVAEAILQHAKINIPLNDLTWNIDASLDSFVNQYVWLGKLNYMEALAKIAEACMGHAYMDRDDVLQIESYTADLDDTVDYTITTDDYEERTAQSNSSGLKNRVVVPVALLAPEETAGEVHTTDDIIVTAGMDDTTVDIEWGDDAVIEAVASVIDQSGISMYITSAVYYAWGCMVSLHKSGGSGGTFKLKVTGKKLILSEANPVVLEDAQSIALYNKRELKYNSNPLIQNSTIAGAIASVLLASYKDPRRDVVVELPANPACEIGDTVSVPVYTPSSTGVSIFGTYIAYRQRFSYDVSIDCELTARKVVTL